MSNFDNDAIDPELVARLASWFGEDVGVPVRRAPEPPNETARRRAEALAAADPALIADLEQRGTIGDDILSVDEPEPDDREPMAMFDGSRYEIDIHSQRSDYYEQPRDIEFFISEQNTPQAVLRDLHRPVLSFGKVQLRVRQDAARDRLVGPRELLRRAFAEHEPLSLPPLASDLIAVDEADRAELMARPWQDAKPEYTAEQDIVRDSDASLWFGELGGYDPDL